MFFVAPGGVFGGELLLESREPEIIEAVESEQAIQCVAEVEACGMAIE